MYAMKVSPTLSVLILMFVFVGITNGQVLRKVEPNKMAEVNDKEFGSDLSFPNLPHSTASTPKAGQSDKKLNYKDLSQKWVEYDSVVSKDVPMKTIPKANYTAKRAAANDLTAPGLSVLTMTNRPTPPLNVRAFTPSGEKDLKDILNPSRR
jgi:hypothetical protein